MPETESENTYLQSNRNAFRSSDRFPNRLHFFILRPSGMVPRVKIVRAQLSKIALISGGLSIEIRLNRGKK